MLRTNHETLAKWYSWSIVALGAVVCSGAIHLLPLDRIDFQFILLAVFTLAFSSYLTLQLPGTKLHIMLSDAIIFFVLLRYGLETAVLLAGADTLIISLNYRWQGINLSIRTALFNAALNICAIAITGIVPFIVQWLTGGLTDYHQTGDLILSLSLMAIAAIIISSLIGSIRIALKNQSNFWQQWKNEAFQGSTPTCVFGATFAGVTFKLIDQYGWIPALMLGVVVGLLYSAYRLYVDEMKKSIKQREQAEQERIKAEQERAQSESARAESESARAEVERERAELEQKRREEAELHVVELKKMVAEQKRLSKNLHESKESFRHASLHDALTGLPNRSFLTDRLNELIERRRCSMSPGFCVLFIDLDRFKSINDSLGHAVADELLILVGRRLERVVRSGDTVARLGGDEFAIVLDNLTEPAAALDFAHRMHETITRPFSVKGHQVFTAPSIGITMAGDEYNEPNDILRDADIAMYHAKEGKLGSFVFNYDLRVKVITQLQTEKDLRQAIERNELVLFYQPIIRLDTGHLAGFEALVRWQHPVRGLVFPDAFIPVAEETGLIVPMTLQILRAACLQLGKWRYLSPHNRELLVSVNLSGRHFTEPDLVEQVSRILQETELDPACLKLEITESAAMENAEDTIQTLNGLNDLGVQLSIDDFGTGYSSLSYLHRFPIDTLKVDRSFVSRMRADMQDSEIVRTIITLAQNLRLQVIAEGVETVEQLRQLRQFECRFAQGYLFARPLPAVEIEKLMDSRSNWLPAELQAATPVIKDLIALPPTHPNSASGNVHLDTEIAETIM